MDAVSRFLREQRRYTRHNYKGKGTLRKDVYYARRGRGP